MLVCLLLVPDFAFRNDPAFGTMNGKPMANTASSPIPIHSRALSVRTFRHQKWWIGMVMDTLTWSPVLVVWRMLWPEDRWGQLFHVGCQLRQFEWRVFGFLVWRFYKSSAQQCDEVMCGHAAKHIFVSMLQRCVSSVSDGQWANHSWGTTVAQSLPQQRLFLKHIECVA